MNFPKIVKLTQELHAHLNGCIRRDTLQQFLDTDGFNQIVPHRVNRNTAFQIFALAHKTVNSPQRLRRIVIQMLEDFHHHNTEYVQIRTTPKSIPSMTKIQYIETVISGIQACPFIQARLLISVNRASGLEQAKQNLEIALATPQCVGLDFSGNPNISSFYQYKEIFQEARQKGLKVTVHTAEYPDDQDTEEIIKFRPDRLGHCNYLSERHRQMIIEQRIPIQLCPSSNIACMSLQSIRNHHFYYFYQAQHPVSICTDDTLLFETDQSKEWKLILDEYSLDQIEVQRILKDSAEMAFDYPNCQ